MNSYADQDSLKLGVNQLKYMATNDKKNFASRQKERLVRQRILEMTSAWLTRVLTAEKFLRLLKSSLSVSFLASHVVVLVYSREKQCYLVKMTTGSKKIPKDLLKLHESSALVRELSIKLKLERCSEGAREEMKRFGAQMCFPIFVQEHLTGILLVGPRPDGKEHDPETIRFFNAITNEIGVQFQKETYYINSITDSMTALYNRKYLEETLLDLFRGKMKVVGGRIALALIDIDHFKLINDRLGHQAGDEVLRVVAQKLQKSVRVADRCFRYGGEEFCVLFCDLVRRDGSVLKSTSDEYVDIILRLVQRLKNSIGESVVAWKGHEIKVTVSIGVTFLSIDGRECSVDGLINEADNMLYAAKKAGRNQILVKRDL